MKRLLPVLCISLVCFLAIAPVFAADPPDANAPETETPITPSAVMSQDPLWQKYSQLKQQFEDMAQHHDAVDKAVRDKTLTDLLSLSEQIITKYPNEPESYEMKLGRVDLLRLQMFLAGNKPNEDEFAIKYQALMDDKSAPEAVRSGAAIRVYGPKFDDLLHTPNPRKDTWVQLDLLVDEFQKKYHSANINQEMIPQLREMELQTLHNSGSPDDLQAEITKLSTDPNEQVAGAAKEMESQIAKVAELSKGPIDLKFTAVDGTTVELASLRGKVVILDFWATWCPDCVENVPGLVELNKKYQAQGLQTIGISLDQEQEKLVSFTREHDMDWPEYFDGKGWQNDISSSYGIDLIPTMWLIDKKGMLVSQRGQDDLDGQVEKLLKE